MVDVRLYFLQLHEQVFFRLEVHLQTLVRLIVSPLRQLVLPRKLVVPRLDDDEFVFLLLDHELDGIPLLLPLLDLFLHFHNRCFELLISQFIQVDFLLLLLLLRKLFNYLV